MIEEPVIAAKWLFALGASGTIALVDLAQIPDVPPWVQGLGLPGIFLAFTIYALRSLYCDKQKETAMRLAEKDAFVKELKDTMGATVEIHSQLVHTSREMLESQKKHSEDLRGLVAENLKAQAMTVSAIEKLTDEIRRKP